MFKRCLSIIFKKIPNVLLTENEHIIRGLAEKEEKKKEKKKDVEEKKMKKKRS